MKKTLLTKDFRTWGKKNYYRLIVFNLILIVLFLLRSAGYFSPYWLISINFIVIFSLVLSAILLGVKSNFLFLIAFVFWLIAAVFKIFFIEVWAERSAIYVYQALVIATVFLFIENIWTRNKNNDR